CLSKVAHPAYVSQIVDADEAPLRGRRPAVVGIVAAAIVLVVFAATLEPVQRTGRTLLGLAGIIPLTVTMTGRVTDEGGAPIAHAFIRVDQGQELANTITVADGSYQMGFAIRTNEPADVSIGATGAEAVVQIVALDLENGQAAPRGAQGFTLRTALGP